MASWLSRATGAFRKPAPPAPEPYSVRCDCGGTVTGIRVSGPQKPACSSCGRPVFVLPVNVYPAAVRKPAKPAPPVESSPMAAVSTATVRERAGRDARSGSSSGMKSGRAAAAVEDKPVPVPDGILLETRSRLLTPFRLVVFIILLIGTFTIWGIWHRQQVNAARANVMVANEAGMKALEEGDFVVASRELSRARDAVDLLQRTDAEANSIRRHCREAVAGQHLASSFEFLADYAAQSRRGNGRLAARDRNTWLILDATISNPEGAEPAIVDMPLQFEGMRFRIEVDSAIVKAAAQHEQATGKARVLFAAQISEIRAPTAGDSDAVLVLNGKSAFLWTNLNTYSALGYFEERPEALQLTQDLLARQLEFVQGAP
ncbi:MAG: hypothetical protein JSS49_07715 [Planctomycetes bacterium]|nr:hypothetical protein [Planctomycetota bacterium]